LERLRSIAVGEGSLRSLIPAAAALSSASTPTRRALAASSPLLSTSAYEYHLSAPRTTVRAPSAVVWKWKCSSPWRRSVTSDPSGCVTVIGFGLAIMADAGAAASASESAKHLQQSEPGAKRNACAKRM